MSKLNQYIGGIVSSITNARSISDNHTVELAKQYAEDNLLKHFSLPRMRISDIEMTIPVAMDAPNPGNFESYDNARLTNAVIDAGAEFIGKKREISEIKRASYRIISEYAKNRLMTPADISSYSNFVAEHFIRIELESTDQEFIPIDRQEALISRINQVVANTLASDTALLGDTNVIIEASQLRDIPRENITYIKIKIREDGMEWAVSENKEGEVESKLLPE